ncbi:MAG: phosphate/phosphite/phosphonate ABC transporter substrate-binding protein [Ardenticatenaceae bacterium]|nr:phosphate/phosphite/phosphonate ABC transporter substrate-binding protein [Ardenticatenaceae bacterium]MCB9445069.1 phosphate/phosphite/phosphonate ABC transporter substrate-binding protein [Ardenticatenaceae bacterium]
MTHQMTVSPDFAPDAVASWYIFNTWLQKQLDENIHLELFNDFESQRQAIFNDQIDIIYANPFDAAVLIREKGFTALVRPVGKQDEVVVAVSAQNPAACIEDLAPGLRLASTDDPDVHLVGMILLEPADINADNIERKIVDSYVIVAKQLLRNEAEVGFFLKEAFDSLSNFTKEQLKVLVESQISIIHHMLLVGPRLADKQVQIRDCMLQMADDPKGQGVLDSLGFTGWEMIEAEDAEFMIDLMDTLG